MRAHMKDSYPQKEVFNFRIVFLLLFTFISLMFYASLSTIHNEKVAAQMNSQLGAWKSTANFPGQGHPYPSFSHDGYYFVNTTDGRKVYSGKPGADGNITSWQLAWADHGGIHGFTAVPTENSVFMLRNGHIAEYPFTSNGLMQNTDYTFHETKINDSFGGRLWVWDTAVYAPLTTGKYLFHLGGFNCPPKTCADSYTYRGDIYYAKLPVGSQFTNTGKQHPNFVPTANGGDGPGKSVFYAPNGGADYGFIYTTRNLHNTVYKVKVNSDGSLGTWENVGDIPSGNGNQRGDIFVIGNTLFAIRGSKVFSSNLDPSTGALAAWVDDPPDLPEAQIVSPWGDHLDGASWATIGNYIYVTGDTKVFYAPITGGAPTTAPTTVATTAPTTAPGSCPTTSTNSYESWQMDQNSASSSVAAQAHPDKNINIRGYESAAATKQLYDRGEPVDSKSPQLSTMLDQTPAILSTFKVYDWNWSANTKGSLLSKYDATMIGLSAAAGAAVRVPDAKFDLIAGTETSGGYTATILFADANSVTIKYTLQDDVVSHYTVHLDNICTDPNLLTLYNQLDAQKYQNSTVRYKLPIVKGKQIIGTAKGDDVRVTIRNSGEFIDPRLKNSFWRGITTLPTGTAPTPTIGGMTPTPTQGSGVNPTSAVPSTTSQPTPIGCTAGDLPAPVFTSPSESAPFIGMVAGQQTISWKAISGATKYLLRIDDGTNGWAGDCTKTQNSGDVCLDNLSTNSYSMNLVNGHKYGIWVAAVNSCGSAKNTQAIRVLGTTAACVTQMTAPTLLSPSSATINAGVQTIKWSNVANATGYSIRINDKSNGWAFNNGDCSNPSGQNSGDVCKDHLSTSTLSYDFNFEPGHSYSLWGAAENTCGWGGKHYGIDLIVAGGGPTATLEPTRPPGSCSTAEIPGFTAPVGGAYPGKVTISWKAVNTARTYELRIDDIGNPWSGDCNNLNSGDYCVNNISKGTTSYDFIGVEGHTYHFWIHSVNHCGEWSKSNDGSVTTPPIVSATSCRIQGYRTLVGPVDQATVNQRWGYYIDKANENNSLSLWVSDAIKQQKVTASGVTPQPVYQSNPYFLVVPGDKTYTVAISEASGYTVSSTYCNNKIDCHADIGTNRTLQQGASRTITCPAGGFADLWWNFTPSSLPTLVVSPTGGPTTTLAAPSPTSCAAVPTLAWRDDTKRYTRTVVSYDGVNVIETIALHLKQITRSGVIVEVSTDNGATWVASDSSENDDHFVTIKNRNTEIIHLQVRVIDACTQTSAVLSQDIVTVPIPSTPMTTTPSVTQAPARSLSRTLLIGGAVLAALAIAGYMIGM